MCRFWGDLRISTDDGLSSSEPVTCRLTCRQLRYEPLVSPPERLGDNQAARPPLCHTCRYPFLSQCQSRLLVLMTWMCCFVFNMKHLPSPQVHPLNLYVICFCTAITANLFCVWVVICRRLCWCSSLAQSTWSGCGRQAAAANMQASKGAFALSGSPYQS